MKQCTICGKGYLPFNTLQVVCGVVCARKVPIQARTKEKKERRVIKARLEALKPLSHWRKQAQTAFNAWIRMRDENLGCISCGTPTAGQWHAGHYLTRGARPELAFDENNVHKQCSVCNDHLSGNLIHYRTGLIAKVGLEEVERLEGPHGPKHLSADDLKAIRDEYRARLKKTDAEGAIAALK